MFASAGMTYAKGEKEPEFDFKGAGVKTPSDLWAKCGHGLICFFFNSPTPPLVNCEKRIKKRKWKLFSLFQLSDGRDYLLSLEHVAAWVADRVLPFLAKRSDDDSEDSEKSQPQPLAAEITEVSSTVHFVNMCLYQELLFFSFFKQGFENIEAFNLVKQGKCVRFPLKGDEALVSNSAQMCDLGSHDGSSACLFKEIPISYFKEEQR